MKKKDLVILILCLALAVFGAVQVIGHFTTQQAGKQAEEERRKIWHAEDATEIPTLPPQTVTEAPAPTEKPQVKAEEEETAAPAEPAETRVTRLTRSMYPDNPGRTVSERFKALRKENKDIVGWLSIGKMQDEAVTQRDNEFYMDHDVSGRKNVSGAVFLDESVSLIMRPFALILYGHNMRDESRFGWLRKYENESFYNKNRFIRFDTMYEEGQYVVFSEGIVSTEEGDAHYLDLFGLNSTRTDERTKAINVLLNVSVLDSAVDVQVDDQILVLVTCVDKDTDRRVVAARRLRDGEEEQQFMN